ncbi:MAG: biotin transporter BioY [Pseudomonadota bacterium]
MSVSLTGPSPALPLQSLADRGLLWRIGAILIGSWVIALSARINVPIASVPMSMQTFAILLIAALSGRNLAGQTVLAYLAQGAAGLPMFASGAGLAYLAGPTGGYLLGFLVAALLVGALADRGWNAKPLGLAASALAGHAVIFLFGVAWLSVLMGGVAAAIAEGLTPFIPGMVVKTALIVATVFAVRRTMAD